MSENETDHAVMRSNDGFRKASTQPTAHIGLLLCGVVSAKHFGVALILPSVDSGYSPARALIRFAVATIGQRSLDDSHPRSCDCSCARLRRVVGGGIVMGFATGTTHPTEGPWPTSSRLRRRRPCARRRGFVRLGDRPRFVVAHLVVHAGAILQHATSSAAAPLLSRSPCVKADFIRFCSSDSAAGDG